MTKPIKLYELAGADEKIRFSPFCWRTRLALAHKGLTPETLPWRLTEKDAIAFSGQGRVPVLVHGEDCIADSWEIALYLERTYPDRPSLFGGAEAQGMARFFNQWADESLHAAIARILLPDIHALLHERDREYFRTTREAAFGTSFASLTAAREDLLTKFRQITKPLRSTLAKQNFLAGAAPNYADHIVFGEFQWARVASPVELLADDDPIAPWRDRMLDAYDGLARTIPAAASRQTV